MLDRVREALFSTLGARVEEARVLDLFAGTGSLGFEALSRGARGLRLVERDPKVCRLLRENLEALNLAQRAEIVCSDALAPGSWQVGGAFVCAGEPSQYEPGQYEPSQYEIVFCDPPYAWLGDPQRRPAVFEALQALLRGHLVAGGVLVFHTPKQVIEDSAFGPDIELEERSYGTSTLWYLNPAERQVEEGDG